MKKAGSSSSRSKTRRTSRSTAASPPIESPLGPPAPELAEALAESLAVGHRPASELSPQDEALLRSFQSNLLSLISHELRTPLTGILNALAALDEGDPSGEFSAAELISMARRNADRLHRTLLALLDLASLDSGTFHARLREVDGARLVRSRLDAHQSLLGDRELKSSFESVDDAAAQPLIADPQKLGRAVDLCLESLIQRAERGSMLNVRISSAANARERRIELRTTLEAGQEELWETAWTQSIAGFEGGVASPASAFAGALLSEQAFLTRMEEGLGSEFLLVHEILRLHHGRFAARREEREVTLSLVLPELSSEDALRGVLLSRLEQMAADHGAMGSVALALVAVPQGTDPDAFRKGLKKNLYRASDAAYALPERRIVAIVMDDCRAEDAPRLIARVLKGGVGDARVGIATAPADGTDANQLIELAGRRLAGQR